MIPWLSLPESERKRLAARERAQRSETKKRGLPVERISVEALWILQRSMCGCEARCAPLNPHAVHGDPDHTVIGHVNGRSFNGGHLIRTVFLQRAECNAREAARENTERASRKRAAAIRGLKPVRLSDEGADVHDADGVDRPSPSRVRAPSSKRRKPEGYVSPLSKESPQYKAAKARKRK